MVKIDIMEEDVVLDGQTSEADRARMAADDLQSIEEEVRREAEATVEDCDDEGDEQCSVEAAETAFDFNQAQERTGRIADSAEDRRESGSTQS
ncbi:BAG1 BAG family molecular chaperone regulator 1 [Gordonibacter sp. An230]|uniref:BAG1 BAG family molecular chaperone regulator 1 n=1 Tax=Gordonibacter sp. An230 TaxID=1965592 RepID=UPI001EF627EF|nr:BAG1 BAG family molecular chaperone regulator 1 [Gordonibacter sp. An230]